MMATMQSGWASSCFLCLLLAGSAIRDVAAQGAAREAVSTPLPTIANSIGMQLVRLPPGEFMMGSSDADADAREDEKPRHRVRINEPFFIGRYEVTQAEYARVMGQWKSFFAPTGPGRNKVAEMGTANFPAEQVTWFDAVQFCQRLTALPAEQAAGRSYRLPTEAEWEYACRAGTETAFSCGDSLDSTQANFNGNYPFGGAPVGPFLNRTAAVGSFQPNAYGLYDMHGNVWEWCGDYYGRNYYQQSPPDDPQGPAEGTRRVIRGGDWYSDGRDCRSAFRYADVPGGTFYALGMRVVMFPTGDPSLANTPIADGRAAEAVTVELADPASLVTGEEWPRWRGPRGDGTWIGAELPKKWPAAGLRRIWRQPLGGGYGGVAVDRGRVYVMDRQLEPAEIERLLCFDAATGQLRWQHQYALRYDNLPYGNGPRVTPTVDADRVYSLGALGHLFCLAADTGAVIWSSDLVRDHNAELPLWGVSASPLVFENLLIVQAGGRPAGCLVALDRETGETVWRSLPDPAGYAAPILIRSAGRDQLVCWTPANIRSVDPRDGSLLWTVPFEVNYGTSIATPIFEEGIVLVSGYYDGSKAIRLGAEPGRAEVIWEDKRNLRGLMAQPLYRDGYAYLLDKRHGLTCFELSTGEKLWDDQNRSTPKGRNPQATMVWVGDEDRALILNSDGELILARLNASGYDEQSRTRIVGETWAHPAYAGNRVYARSDSELVCVSLAD